jgi:hypothetical protein
MSYGWEENHHTNTWKCGGCLAKVLVPTPKVQKVGPKRFIVYLLGMLTTVVHIGFLVHETKNPDVHVNTIMEPRNASFFGNVFPCLRQEHASSSTRIYDVHEKRNEQSEDEEIEPRRSKRQRTEKSFGPDFMTYIVEGAQHLPRSGYRFRRTSIERSRQEWNWFNFTESYLGVSRSSSWLQTTWISLDIEEEDESRFHHS